MSVRLMGEVWALDLPTSEAYVLLALADHAHDDGTHVYPSQRRIAWKVGMTERNVQRILRRLERRGVLVETRAPSAHHAREYRITLTTASRKAPYVTQNVAPTNCRPDESVARTPDKLSPVRATPVSPKPSVNRQENHHSGQDGFDQWWEAYPRKVKRADARKAWGQIAQARPPLATMLAALAWQRRLDQWQKDRGAFVPYPATYLRAEQWADDPPTPSRFPTHHPPKGSPMPDCPDHISDGRGGWREATRAERDARLGRVAS